MSEDAHEASAWGPSLLLSEYRALLARADRAEAAEAVIEKVRAGLRKALADDPPWIGADILRDLLDLLPEVTP